MQRLKSRQDPVSCELCRAKKLKCNREYPCSNCVARGVTCRGSRSVTRNESVQQPTDIKSILERLDRLESIVVQQTKPQPTILNDDRPPSKRIALTPTSTDTPATISDINVGPDEDSIALENVGTREDSLLTCLSNDMVFKLRKVEDILNRYTDTFPTSQHSSIHIPLPEYLEAVELLRNYELNVDHFVRVLYIPSIRSLLKSFYQNVKERAQMKPCEAALLLSIFAISAYFSHPSENSLLPGPDDLLKLAIILSKAALDALDYSKRTTSGSIEDVQANILMAFVVYHLDGFSARGRSLCAAAMVIARDLRLHRIDDGDAVPDINLTTEAIIEREVMRRVWWHITSTDWLLASYGGPQENCYFINPKHIQVKLPRNCSDEDISTKPSNYAVPLSTPTSMSYFIYRIRLAEICREIIDSLPTSSPKLCHLRYDEVLSLDRKLEAYLSDLPGFLQTNPESQIRGDIANLEITNHHIASLRYFINAAAHSRRCKLHQPFLIRQSVDSRYAYSRKICLESARAVIQSQQAIHVIDRARTNQRLGAVVHFMHLSVIVLVMDLCFNKDRADQTQLKVEVKAALKMFEDITGISPLPGRLLGSLLGTLQKHKVQLPESNASNSIQTTPNIPISFSIDTSNIDQDISSMEPPRADDWNILENSQFEDFWQSVLQDQSLDTLQWDHLFAEIESRAM